MAASFLLNYSTPTITDVALIIAYASLPTASSSSSTAFFDIVEVNIELTITRIGNGK